MSINNNVMLYGRVVESDLIKKLDKTKNGTNILYFTLAVKNKKNVDYIPLKAFGNLAKVIATYCEKGDLVSVAAHLSIQNIADEKGNWTRYWSVVVKEFQILAHPANNKDNQINTTDIPLANNQNVSPNDHHLADSQNDEDDDRPWELKL